jgi:hypothetical protein
VLAPPYTEPAMRKVEQAVEAAVFWLSAVNRGRLQFEAP